VKRILITGPIDRNLPVWLVAAVTLGSGLLNLLSVQVHQHLRSSYFADVFPLEFLHLSRFLTLLIGFFLVISSLNVYKRKQRAWQGAVLLTSLSIPIHVIQGPNIRGAISSAILLAVLLFARRKFTVKSSTRTLAPALLGIVLTGVVAFGYGVTGFWFLDKRDFEIDFTIVDSIRRTLRFLTLQGDPEIIPRTHHARWFLDSLYAVTMAAIAYAIASLYRPMLYRFRTQEQERAIAKSIVAQYGRSSMDYFKTWRDKSFFFLPSRRGVIAYRVATNQAVALGDPVCPDEEVENATRLFKGFCHESDWTPAFYQASGEHLSTYQSLGFRKLKIGDDAIVDLAAFSLEGRSRRELRHTARTLEKLGIEECIYDPPISASILNRVREISDEWLGLPGHRERQFTLGLFDDDYVRTTSLFVLREKDGRDLAFVNLIPSYAPGEATIDLMRRRTHGPNGIMDYLLIRLFDQLRVKGFTRFNFGMAPMAGFQEREEATAEERLIHHFFRKLHFLFNYEGLRAYKAKFATDWEPRYLIYRSPLDLPRIALALSRISEIREKGHRKREQSGGTEVDG
jgi:phosphatidylglycerol lysyltransferase